MHAFLNLNSEQRSCSLCEDTIAEKNTLHRASTFLPLEQFNPFWKMDAEKVFLQA